MKIVIPGEPKSKLRHRTTSAGIQYSPKDNLEYENWVKQCFIISPQKKRLKGQIDARIVAFFSIPKSTSNKKRNAMCEGLIRPTKKPDTDNIAKIILDSLNSLAYHDDKQIVNLTVSKYYSDEPRVVVYLSEVS